MDSSPTLIEEGRLVSEWVMDSFQSYTP